MWVAIALDTVYDGNADAIDTDPAVAMIASRPADGSQQARHLIKVRDAISGNLIEPAIEVFNSRWEIVDIGVLNDTNGDGLVDDPSVAVLARNRWLHHNMVKLYSIRDGTLVKKWEVFTSAWSAIAIAGSTPSGDGPEVAVLATDIATGESRIEAFRINENRKARSYVSGPNVEVKDLAVITDLDGDGARNDHGFAVLGTRTDGINLVRIRRVDDGSYVKEIYLAGDAWVAQGLAIMPDMTGNNFEEIAGVATGAGADRKMIKIRDLDTGDAVRTFILD